MLDGYLLELLTVDALAHPVPHADVVVIYVPVPNAANETSQATRLTARARDDGTAMFCVPRAGACSIHAVTGVQYSSELALALDGPSGRIRRTIALDREYEGASLRVSLVSCGSSAIPVDDYCLNLFGAVGGEQAFRLCSDAVEPDGTFKSLRPGHYLVEAAPRYVGPPVFYIASTQSERTPVELVDRRETTLRICVHLGGRLAVLVKGEKAAESDERQATMEVLPVDSFTPIHLAFREPIPTLDLPRPGMSS